LPLPGSQPARECAKNEVSDHPSAGRNAGTKKNILTRADNFQIVQNVKNNFHRVQAGNDGRGSASFRREKCVPFGGQTVAVAGAALVVRTINLEKQP